jgi:hypothetical protein
MAACCSLCKKTRGCKSWEYRCVESGASRARGAPPPCYTARRPRSRPAHAPRSRAPLAALRARSASNMGYGCSLYKPGAERVAFEGCKCTQVSGSVKRVKK